MLLGILSLGLGACSTDSGKGLDTRYRNFLGKVEARDGDIGNGFDIRLDDGTWLEIDNSQSVTGIKDGDRVVFTYTLVGEADPVDGNKRFIAVLNHYYKVLGKEPVLQSFIDEDYQHRQDSIGNDPIRVDDAWFGGEYLNIWFSVARRRSTNELHFINLVADNVEWDGEVLDVYLRHNGYEDVPSAGSGSFVYGQSLVSFDLTGLIPEGQSGVGIRLHWTAYRGTDWSEVRELSEDLGRFIPYGIESDSQKTSTVTEYDPANNFK